MNTNQFLAILFIAATMLACKKDKEKKENTDYIIFGHYYGECTGENCIEIYKLGATKLFEDTKDVYPTNAFYTAELVELPKAKFDMTSDLNNYFPAGLLNTSATVIGTPDATDAGGLYIEYNKGGIRKYWLIDKMKSKVPSEYHAFMDKVDEKILQLQ